MSKWFIGKKVTIRTRTGIACGSSAFGGNTVELTVLTVVKRKKQSGRWMLSDGSWWRHNGWKYVEE